MTSEELFYDVCEKFNILLNRPWSEQRTARFLKALKAWTTEQSRMRKLSSSSISRDAREYLVVCPYWQGENNGNF